MSIYLPTPAPTIPSPVTGTTYRRYAVAGQAWQIYAAGYTVAATTLTALDTTNATLAFTVPANGIVDILVQLFYTCVRVASANAVVLGLLNHTGGAQVGLNQEIVNNQVASTTLEAVNSVTFHLTGLTPGALQLDLAAFFIAGTGNSATVVVNSTSVPLLMQAKASV